MQTFLPYADFGRSAKCLDYRRLGKQRVEAKQMLNCLEYRNSNDLYMVDKNGTRRKRGWLNHSAVLMWVGYNNALAHYHNIMIEEWIYRGYNNNMPLISIEYPIIYPSWVGDEKIHASHRSNLLRKDHEWYSRFSWSESPDLEYIWIKTGHVV